MENEQVVLGLYFNQNKTICEIAKIGRKSLRDIGEIINREIKEKERLEIKSLFVLAYDLFRQEKKALEVAITLNVAQIQVTQYYTEYLKLIQLDGIFRIYEQPVDNINHFVNLYAASKSANMDVQQVVDLLVIANKHLPLSICECENLLKQNNVPEYNLRVSSAHFQNLNDQILDISKRKMLLDWNMKVLE